MMWNMGTRPAHRPAGLLLPLVLCQVLFAQSMSEGEPGTDPADWWNRFRGPNGSGVMEEARIPVHFGPEENVLWRTSLGKGPSSPVLWDDRIFVTEVSANAEHELAVVCLDRSSGEVRWRRTILDPDPREYYSHCSPAAPTPTTDADHVYVSFPTYGVICYDHDGT